MRPSFFLPVLATAAAAAPTYPQLTSLAGARGRSIGLLADYFDLLSRKVAAFRADAAAAMTCDLAGVVMPDAASALPPPGTDLVLAHIGLGRGVQNYTCASASSPPAAKGALATLFNANCVASSFPDLLEMLPGVALQFPFNPSSAMLPIGPSNLVVSGHHYFNAEGTPVFDLTVPSGSPALPLGDIACTKVNATAAPVGAVASLDGAAAVPWLKLNATTEEGKLREVYRLTTAGGSAPETCEGMPAEFSVEYAALYWFYGHKE